MNKLEAIKWVAGTVVSAGVGAIVGNAVKFTTPSDVKKISKICISIGSVFLSGMLSAKAEQYAEEKIDEGVDIVRGLIEEKPEESEE